MGPQPGASPALNTLHQGQRAPVYLRELEHSGPPRSPLPDNTHTHTHSLRHTHSDTHTQTHTHSDTHTQERTHAFRYACLDIHPPGSQTYTHAATCTDNTHSSGTSTHTHTYTRTVYASTQAKPQDPVHEVIRHGRQVVRLL